MVLRFPTLRRSRSRKNVWDLPSRARHRSAIKRWSLFLTAHTVASRRGGKRKVQVVVLADRSSTFAAFRQSYGKWKARARRRSSRKDRGLVICPRGLERFEGEHDEQTTHRIAAGLGAPGRR